MKTEVKEIYKCDHCNKLYQIKKFAIDHELNCSKNPLNSRPCLFCHCLEKRKRTHYYDTYSGEQKIVLNLLYCTHKEIFLYPPSVERKNNAIDLGDESNNPMPKQCNHYDKSFDDFF